MSRSLFIKERAYRSDRQIVARSIRSRLYCYRSLFLISFLVIPLRMFFSAWYHHYAAFPFSSGGRLEL
jgi:hypothetical protein